MSHMGEERTIELPASLDSLGRFQAFLSSFAEDAGFEGDRLSEMQLVVEEALVNIFKYAYPGDVGTVSLTCARDAGKVVLTVIDRGLAFDPLSLPAPESTTTLEERKAGGWGIPLMRRLTDRIDYRRDGDRNILTLVMSK